MFYYVFSLISLLKTIFSNCWDFITEVNKYYNTNINLISCSTGDKHHTKLRHIRIDPIIILPNTFQIPIALRLHKLLTINIPQMLQQIILHNIHIPIDILLHLRWIRQ